MQDLIEAIEKRKLTKVQLVEKLEKEYNQSKTIFKDLSKQFKKFTKTLPDYDEEFDYGVDGIFDMRHATQTFEEYKRDRELNAEGRKKTIWDFALENALFGWEMKRAYYSYKAYEIVLENELRRMQLSYRD